jgi:hypothetical protein
MIRDKMFDDERIVLPFDALVLNDDLAMWFDEEHVDLVIDKDFQICQGLGLLYKKKKTFLSNIGCVFCE